MACFFPTVNFSSNSQSGCRSRWSTSLIYRWVFGALSSRYIFFLKFWYMESTHLMRRSTGHPRPVISFGFDGHICLGWHISHYLRAVISWTTKIHDLISCKTKPTWTASWLWSQLKTVTVTLWQRHVITTSCVEHWPKKSFIFFCLTV